MKTPQKALLTVALVMAVATAFYLQQRAQQALRAENAALRDSLAVASVQAAPPAQEKVDAAELERLRDEHDELLRLRAEVSRLRSQLAEAKRARPAAAPATAPPAPPRNEAEQSPEPIETFVANANATLAAGQMLAFGGWTTAPGMRTMVFLQPKILELGNANQVGQVALSAWFIEAPEEVLGRMVAELDLKALETLKANGKASSSQSLLTAEQARVALQTFHDAAGVNVLSAPGVTTGDGRSAAASSTSQKIVAGQEQTVGPSLDVEPRIAADGSSVSLTVSARLRRVNPAAQ